jgi:hypothetical protein
LEAIIGESSLQLEERPVSSEIDPGSPGSHPRGDSPQAIWGVMTDCIQAWLLTPTADGSGTVVQYEVYLDPGFWIPEFLVTRSLGKDLRAALTHLRVEHVEAAK